MNSLIHNQANNDNNQSSTISDTPRLTTEDVEENLEEGQESEFIQKGFTHHIIPNPQKNNSIQALIKKNSQVNEDLKLINENNDTTNGYDLPDNNTKDKPVSNQTIPGIENKKSSKVVLTPLLKTHK
jgi:hypothetical protein